MPVYEYRCPECRKRSSVLVRGFNAPTDLTCQHCGSGGLTRLFSTFALRRGTKAVADGELGEGGDEMAGLERLESGDPREMAKAMRQMGEETGDEMGPEFEETVRRMEKGEMPEDFEDGAGAEGPDGGSEEPL